MSDEQKRDTVTDEMLERLDLLASRIVLRDGDSEIAVVPVLVAEIKRQRAILAALREPSDAVLVAAHKAYVKQPDPTTSAIRAAVAAAEQEVGRE